MPPIRIGIVGLSASGNWASAAHLPYLLQSDKYRVVGVSNSSVESSQKAIIAHSLPEDTKPYGSTTELAKDPNVDLAVVSAAHPFLALFLTVRLDLHSRG